MSLVKVNRSVCPLRQVHRSMVVPQKMQQVTVSIILPRLETVDEAETFSIDTTVESTSITTDSALA